MLQAIFCLLLLLPNLSYSKTTIDSDQLDVNFQKRTAIFKGNVKISGDEIDFTADVVEVMFLAENTIKSITAKSSIKLINATINREGQKYNLQCREIFIDMIEKIITANDATLSNDNSTMTGEKIIYIGQVLLSGKKQVKISIENESEKPR
jgi:lipopolysaccharide transport protein LptA